MKLFSPETDISRPILDRVKENLFNVLCNYGLPNGKIVADLFCGVGSLGLESLSRGAEFVLFVEKDQKIASILKKNIAKAGFTDKSKVLTADAFKTAAPFDKAGTAYDLVFIDPPYVLMNDADENSPFAHLMTILSSQTKPDAVIIVRTNKKQQILDTYADFKIIDTRNWASMTLTFMARQL